LGDYANADLNLGNHTLTVTPYDLSGQAYDSLTTNFTVVEGSGGANDDPVGTPVTVGLSLVDSESDTVIGPITEGSTIDLARVGSSLTLKAEPSEPVSQVDFDLSGATEINQTENVSPYALAGDRLGDYANADLNLGNHTLTVTPYDLSGQAYDSLTTNFTVVDNLA
jgi:hypothetical protein